MTSHSTIRKSAEEAERKVAALINELTGFPARRALGAGRKDDVGDIDGVPQTCVQVAHRRKDLGIADAVRNKPVEAEVQRVNRGATFAATFIRLNGGQMRVILTPEQWATLVREATRP